MKSTMKKTISFMLTLVLIINIFAFAMPLTAVHATEPTTLPYEPYAKVQYDYSSTVQCGTIRYVHQITNNSLYYTKYWPKAAYGSYESANKECGTACISMALSYIGINKIPKDVLTSEGKTSFSANHGATSVNFKSNSFENSESHVSNLFQKYQSGNGKYSPIVIRYLYQSGGTAGHAILLVGKDPVHDNTYYVIDPAGGKSIKTGKIVNNTIEYKNKSYPLARISQWYNKNATMTIESVDMFRLYNPNTGEHFYTGSTIERDDLVNHGWNYEGIGFTAPKYTGDPVHRYYHQPTGEHLYTMDEREIATLTKENGWSYEGVAFNSASSDGAPQYRLHNPNATVGAYHFTNSVEERDFLISIGWEDQGIGFYSLY